MAIRSVPTEADERLVPAVRILYERNETDNGGGGVHSSHVASYLGVSERTVRRRFRNLCERGRLESVQGIDPETGLARWSVVPADRRPTRVRGR